MVKQPLLLKRQMHFIQQQQSFNNSSKNIYEKNFLSPTCGLIGSMFK